MPLEIDTKSPFQIKVVLLWFELAKGGGGISTRRGEKLFFLQINQFEVVVYVFLFLNRKTLYVSQYDKVMATFMNNFFKLS